MNYLSKKIIHPIVIGDSMKTLFLIVLQGVQKKDLFRLKWVSIKKLKRLGVFQVRQL